MLWLRQSWRTLRVLQWKVLRPTSAGKLNTIVSPFSYSTLHLHVSRIKLSDQLSNSLIVPFRLMMVLFTVSFTSKQPVLLVFIHLCRWLVGRTNFRNRA